VYQNSYFLHLSRLKLSLIFAGKAGSQLLQFSTVWDSILVSSGLPAKIRLVQKWMALANTLAYYDMTTFTAVN